MLRNQQGTKSKRKSKNNKTEKLVALSKNQKTTYSTKISVIGIDV